MEPQLKLLCFFLKNTQTAVFFQNIQQALEQRRPVVDSLTSDVGHLRSLVEKSRPGVARHHDLEVLEKDVSNIVTRWGNVKEQVGDRWVKL